MDKLKLKKAVKQSKFGRWLVSIKDFYKNKRNYYRRKKYIPQITELFGGGKISIITSNCFAGRIMQDLKMEYNSPTLGLYFMFPDYIEFLQHLEYYLKEAKIEFVEHSKYSIGDERRAERSITHHWYPIGLLDGKVEIHFLHYHTEEEAASKWYRRANRVNIDNLFVIGMEQNLCTEQDIRYFDTLPFENKIMFSTQELKELKSNCFVKEFAGTDSVGSPYGSADVYYRYIVNRYKSIIPSKDSSTKSINNRLKKTRLMKLQYLMVCFFKLSGKKDRNAWLRKNNIFGLFGEGSNYQPHTLPSNPKLIKIHNNVRIAEGVTIYEHDGVNAVFARMDGEKDPKWRIHQSCIEIFDNCFIGGKSILIGNLRIGPNAIVAGGSVVTKDVKPGEIVAGNPAKVVGNFFDLMERRKIQDYDQPELSIEERNNQLWEAFSKKR